MDASGNRPVRSSSLSAPRIADAAAHHPRLTFQWRADISRDGGKTWVADRWIMEANRIGR
jgi:hypothetical protein